MSYVLEVQRFVKASGYEHVGYLQRVFKNKNEACAYYDSFNLHMRSLNAHNTWRSDWDPSTRLRYVVRNFDCELLSVPQF